MISRERILDILADDTSIPIADIHPESKLADLHLDSLSLMNAIVAIEGVADMDISAQQIAGLVTVGDLYGLFEAK